MPRRLIGPEEREKVAREVAIAEASRVLVAGLPSRKKGRGSVSKARVEEIVRQAEEMRVSRDFENAGPRHLVALWAWCHEQTYGVAPAMTAKEWSSAGFAAGTLIKKEFGGKVAGAVAFLQWTWAEEGRSVKWRRENQRPVTPLGWRLQFGARHVVKWRANGGGQ